MVDYNRVLNINLTLGNCNTIINGLTLLLKEYKSQMSKKAIESYKEVIEIVEQHYEH
jgi:hypothetical protein